MQHNTKVREADLELLLDILKNISFAGFIALLVNAEITLTKVIVTLSATLLTFVIRRRMITKKEEVSHE